MLDNRFEPNWADQRKRNCNCPPQSTLPPCLENCLSAYMHCVALCTGDIQRCLGECFDQFGQCYHNCEG